MKGKLAHGLSHDAVSGAGSLFDLGLCLESADRARAGSGNSDLKIAQIVLS